MTTTSEASTSGTAKRRVMPRTVQPDTAEGNGTVAPVHRVPAEAELSVPLNVVVVRERLRRPCFECRHRRVLYRIGLFVYAGPTATTDARCAPCWGIREMEG
jgi:hypothetical protein